MNVYLNCRNGYPDLDYLKEVKLLLAEKGIVEEGHTAGGKDSSLESAFDI